ncbi:phage tail assembly chaperone [Amorphus sp. MBR-141]
MPAAAERVWSAFWRLDGRRSSNGFGANAISHTDVDRFLARNRINLWPWELEALDAMETVRLRFLNRGETEAAPQVSAQPMTPALFTAMFGEAAK